ncbi:MAG: twin-arginine translocase TatA/TatE family subunit [Fimbriimonadaceae bacterium]|nr:twin-arginine translocase TatA/TatE family subunit [Fimbriimonadaceae bacterium]
MNTLAFGLPSGTEWIWILVVVLLLFGGKKIPELMRGVGKGVGELQKGLEEGKRQLQSAVEEETKAPTGADK